MVTPGNFVGSQKDSLITMMMSGLSAGTLAAGKPGMSPIARAE